MTRAQLDRQPGEVAAMFDAIADRYDLLNDALSLGQDRYWRGMVARAVGARPGETVLDLAAGTGTSSATFTRSGARCVACDFSIGMLRTGARRQRDPAIAFVAGDALDLPFADAAFDAVTISFGLRNVADTGAGLAELLRVTRPGGRLVVCEFSLLRAAPLDALYGRFLSRFLPAVARRLSPSADAYDYLAESIRDWPAPPDLARKISAAGWTGTRWVSLSLGVVALHLARRPQR
jgi:demethylmenaquinone methyltransferase/2-methoxy-6-polyprenyl-1,4-benzoquinol methylase